MYLHDLIAGYFNNEEKRYFDDNFGFVEASIGRMVPATPASIKEKEPLAVCVEPFCTLPVDRDAFKGFIPDIKNMLPYSPFELFIERKLYMHNMSHAVCAYLGNLFGYKYIWEAAGDPRIRYIALGALTQSACALSIKHGAEIKPLIEHAFDLLTRYDNKLLGDTIVRVGNDTKRKLSPTDRIPGALKCAAENGIPYNFIAAGLAAGLLFAPDGDTSSSEVRAFADQNGAAEAIKTYSGIETPEIVQLVDRMYRLLKQDPSRAVESIIREII